MATLGAGLLAAGCGQDGPAQAEFVRQADAVCAAARPELRGLADRRRVASAAGDPRVAFTRSAALLRASVSAQRRSLDRIDALDRPAQSADRIGAWLAQSRERAAATDALADAFATRDEARVAQLSGRVDALATRDAAAARALGLRACTQPAG